MPSLKVVLITDRPDGSHALAEAVRTVADCCVVDTGEPWHRVESIDGVIADIALERPEAARCLRTLSDKSGGRRLPLVCLVRERSDATLRGANRLGATACLSVLTEPGSVVAALVCQIVPEKTMTDLLFERNVARTGMVLADLLGAARFGRIDPDKVDDGIDPVVRALREGDLGRWLDLVQAHDDGTLRHCLLVAGLTAHFAVHLGLSVADRTVLVRSGIVHDVGKARIPLAILNKPGPLDADEMAVMRTHPAVGHTILLDSGVTDPPILRATRHHHEMLDGSGYPDGLRGDEIDDAIRLLTICDIYAALIERRPYRRPMTEAGALRILRSMTGKLEPALVEAFADSLGSAGSRPQVFSGAFERGSEGTRDADPSRRGERPVHERLRCSR